MILFHCQYLMQTPTCSGSAQNHNNPLNIVMLTHSKLKEKSSLLRQPAAKNLLRFHTLIFLQIYDYFPNTLVFLLAFVSLSVLLCCSSGSNGGRRLATKANTLE